MKSTLWASLVHCLLSSAGRQTKEGLLLGLLGCISECESRARARGARADKIRPRNCRRAEAAATMTMPSSPSSAASPIPTTIATDSHAVTAYQLYLYRGSTVFRSIPIAALNVAPYDACQQHRNFGHLPPPSARRRRRHACPDYYVPPAEQLTGLLSIRLRQ